MDLRLHLPLPLWCVRRKSLLLRGWFFLKHVPVQFEPPLHFLSPATVCSTVWIRVFGAQWQWPTDPNCRTSWMFLSHTDTQAHKHWDTILDWPRRLLCVVKQLKRKRCIVGKVFPSLFVTALVGVALESLESEFIFTTDKVILTFSSPQTV